MTSHFKQGIYILIDFVISSIINTVIHFILSSFLNASGIGPASLQRGEAEQYHVRTMVLSSLFLKLHILHYTGSKQSIKGSNHL
jgi:hypothetical protein